ncbi:MAG: septum site-determining protein MinC [Clostridia bacterium]|nr:septum site-determining protein MinC [Clostridia bacterium]
MEENIVTFKGSVNGLIVIMKEDEPFEAVMEQMERKIASAGKFFKGASLSVKYRGRKLSEKEAAKIHDLLVQKSGAEIKEFSEDTETSTKPVVNQSEVQQHRFEMKNYFFKGIDEGRTKFYKGTLRSGQLVSFDGNLVVIGDVNPGAEVVATGNVAVMGSLRGIVHAGADGNKDAMVVAFNLQPMQLRIADVITRSPDEKESRNPMVPELAYVKGDMVYIERFLPQR